jgi:hypothetical protein
MTAVNRDSMPQDVFGKSAARRIIQRRCGEQMSLNI